MRDGRAAAPHAPPPPSAAAAELPPVESLAADLFAQHTLASRSMPWPPEALVRHRWRRLPPGARARWLRTADFVAHIMRADPPADPVH